MNTDDICKVLREAAEVIKRNGLCKTGNFYDERAERTLPRKLCPVCIYGAIDIAAGIQPGDGGSTLAVHAHHAIRLYITKRFETSPIRWNDAQNRTLEEVVAALLNCADVIEREASCDPAAEPEIDEEGVEVQLAECPDPSIDGTCRHLTCARCGQHTNNATQGHHWRWCHVTRAVRDFHFCCPDDCELEAAEQKANGDE